MANGRVTLKVDASGRWRSTKPAAPPLPGQLKTVLSVVPGPPARVISSTETGSTDGASQSFRAVERGSLILAAGAFSTLGDVSSLRSIVETTMFAGFLVRPT